MLPGTWEPSNDRHAASSRCRRLPVLLLFLACSTQAGGGVPARGVTPTQVPFRRLLSDPDNVYASALLDPCAKMDLVDKLPYDLATVLWPNSEPEQWSTEEGFTAVYLDPSQDNAGRWFAEPGLHRNPCDDSFGEQLRAADADMALYTLQAGRFQMLRSRLSQKHILKVVDDRQAVKNGSLDSCCTSTSAVFNRDGTGPPFYAMRLDPNHRQEAPGRYNPNGVAVFSYAILVSRFNGNGSVVGPIQPQPLASNDKSAACVACTKFNMTKFLSLSGVLGDDPTLNATSLNFGCFDNHTCAWGPGFCEACLDGAYVGKVMPSWFSYFVNYKYSNGTAYAESDRRNAEMIACNTFCNPVVYIRFWGTDAQSQHLSGDSRSPAAGLRTSPLMALKAFNVVFGISSAFVSAMDNEGLI